MIDIKYKGNFEVSDIDGESIADARGRFKKSFDIADKAAAFLNGKKIKPADEGAIILQDSDTLVFKNAGGHRLAFLVGALVLAMAITGGIFASGFTNATTTLNASAITYNFADVSANTSSTPSWSVHGMQKGSTGSGSLFDIDTATSGYTGDIAVTIFIANADELVSVYRNLTLSLEVRDSANALMDINSDGFNNSADFTLLTLENGTVTFSLKQGAPDVYTVMLRKGSYICNPFMPAWTPTSGAPQLYCELAQQ